MHAGLELKKSSSPLQDNLLYYWHRETPKSSAEVDYIIQCGDKIVPLEVKSGKSHNAASYNILMRERGFKTGAKTSADNLSSSANTYIIPLYLVGECENLIRP